MLCSVTPKTNSPSPAQRRLHAAAKKAISYPLAYRELAQLGAESRWDKIRARAFKHILVTISLDEDQIIWLTGLWRSV